MTELGAAPLLGSAADSRDVVATRAVAHASVTSHARGRVGYELRLRRLLATADVLALAVAAIVTGLVDGDVRVAEVLLTLPVWVLGAKLAGLYDRDRRVMRALTVDEIPQLWLWAATGSLALSLASAPLTSRAHTIGSVALFACILCAVAALLRAVARYGWRLATPRERVLLLGSGPSSRALARKLELFPDMHATTVGVVPDDELADDLAVAVDRHAPDGCDRVLLVQGAMHQQVVNELLARCRQAGMKFGVIPEHGSLGTAGQLDHVADLPMVHYNTWSISRSTLLVKRLVDLAVGLPLLVLATPLLVALAVVVKLDSPGPAFFVQQRAGRGGRPFRMVKFRTMVVDAEAQLADVVALDELVDPVFKLRRDPRVTRVGRWMRHTSLDELPQLVNVVAGSMSLVGPRPEQLDLVERYRPENRFRLEVKPGISGPMQVYGRGELRFDERLAVERDYIEDLSLRRDARILLLTMGAVLGRRGAY
jgi:exopolysaccharide biosynthesis polyprenyl glycosylphosphotransferase